MSSARRWRILEIAVWTCGLLLVMAYVGARSIGELERRQAIAEFPGMAANLLPALAGAADLPADGTLPAAATPLQSDWSLARVQAYAASIQASGPGTSAPVALLRIPRIGLEVPVYPDLNERNLNRGAALVIGSATPDSDGNVAIAAHRDGYFRSLQEVALGDVVEVDLAAMRRSYRVTELSIVDPTDLRPVQPTAGAALTLVTCYPFYFVGSAPQRYIVRAEAMP